MIALRVLGASAAVLLATLGGASPAHAQDLDIVLPAGLACPDFDVRVQASGDERKVHEFRDRDGNVVRRITAGRGADLTLTNVGTGASVSLRSSGAVNRETILPDGTVSTVATGHQVLILFPTDVPAGPTTTLYVGRITFTVSPDGVFTLTGTAGRATDLCAALA